MRGERNGVGEMAIEREEKRDGTYITDLRHMTELESTGNSIYLCRFESNRYSDELFSVLKVDLPGSIAKRGMSRKADYLAGRYCAVYSLNRLGVHGFSVVPDDHGCPCWPVGVAGSISHSAGTAVAVACRNDGIQGIGIDIESISTKSAAIITEGILCSREKKLLSNVPAPPAEIAVLMFSIKESFYKAAFPSVRAYIDFDAVVIEEIDVSEKTFRLTIAEDLSETLIKDSSYSGRFVVRNGCVITLLIISNRNC